MVFLVTVLLNLDVADVDTGVDDAALAAVAGDAYAAVVVPALLFLQLDVM